MPLEKTFAKDLKKASLRYISDTSPGVMRQKSGKTFKYFDTKGKLVKSKKRLSRIESLKIPPAWRSVWISPSPSGYLQAVGQDAKGRKQYIYHPDWQSISQANKFSRMAFFGDVLPKIRKKIRSDLEGRGHTKDKILAAVVWLLENTLIRVGNTEYADENDSYGLTTLRNKHVSVRGKNVKFEFKGKSSVHHVVEIVDPKIAKIIKECFELPGYEIFQYLDENGEKHVVDSSDVNNYLRSVTGEDVTAKDFRTWGGTVLCATCLNEIGISENKTKEKKNVREAVKKVALHLRNTPSVSRSYYIHPTILSTYEKGSLIPNFEKSYKNYDRRKHKLDKNEFATLSLLRKYS